MRLATAGLRRRLPCADHAAAATMNRPVTRVIAYLWHPLPLWEIANSGHVDALMVALMLSGLVDCPDRTRAPRRRPDRVFGAGQTLCGAGAGRDLAPVGSENAAGRDRRHGRALLSALFVGRLGCSRIPDQRLSAEEGISAGYELWPLSLWRLVFGEHRGDVVVYLVLAALVALVCGACGGFRSC